MIEKLKARNIALNPTPFRSADMLKMWESLSLSGQKFPHFKHLSASKGCRDKCNISCLQTGYVSDGKKAIAVQ